jgi:hypothetical protein
MTQKPSPPCPVSEDPAAAVKVRSAIRSRPTVTASKNKEQARKRHRASREPGRKTYAVADGRVTVGCVVPVGSSRCRALDHQGRGIGIFKTLKEAIAALPQREDER